MSHKLISHNPDLKKLRDEGYEVNIKSGYLIITSVPYVKSTKEIDFGFLVCPLNLAGDQLLAPSDHTAHFAGEHPCDKNGDILKGVVNSPQNKTITDDVVVDYYLSAKPPSGKYEDYYEKITTYVKIFEGHAQAIDSSVTAKTFKVVKIDDPDSVFNYIDTNSSRAGVQAVSEKLGNLKIAIVGLGGTGSYVLDFVSKTLVREIHLFDGDEFFSHNAFRSPGAATIEDLNSETKKTDYFGSIYTNMRKYIYSHPYHITDSEVDELVDMHFVFICVDQGGAKKIIIEKLLELGTPFIDVGAGVNEIDNSLIGSIRVTTFDKGRTDHLEKWISFSDGENNDYNQNIQIAELNALNASLAVIKWKKMFGVYHDQGNELNACYEVSTNKLYNEDIKA